MTDDNNDIDEPTPGEVSGLIKGELRKHGAILAEDLEGHLEYQQANRDILKIQKQNPGFDKTKFVKDWNDAGGAKVFKDVNEAYEGLYPEKRQSTPATLGKDLGDFFDKREKARK